MSSEVHELTTSKDVRVLQTLRYLLGTEGQVEMEVWWSWVTSSTGIQGQWDTFLYLCSPDEVPLHQSAAAGNVWIRVPEGQLIPQSFLGKLASNPVDAPELEMFPW